MIYCITLIAAALTAYLVGSIPFGFIIGQCHGLDIRKEGSGNIGATNVTRVIGPWWGKLCFLLDFLKGFVPVGIAAQLVQLEISADPLHLLAPLAALAVVFGHIFPVYLKFKGGKGIATAAGAIFPLCPLAVICGLLSWVILFLITRYVSVASIAAAVVLPLVAVLLFVLKGRGAPDSAVSVILFILLGILAIVKHKSNIVRLLNGTENRFTKGEKK